MNKRTSKSPKPRRCCPDIGEVLQARFFRALCDPNRIALLTRLARCCKPCTVSEMSRCCPTDFSVVSRHLAILREAGILEAQKRGKEVYYSVRFEELVATLRSMADAIEACCLPKDPTRRKASHE